LQTKLFFLSLLIIHSSLSAQRTREVQTQNHVWTSINSQMRVSNKWSIAADLHVRRTNFLQSNSFFLVRTGVLYSITKQLSAGAGYAHMWLANQKDATELFSNENRLHQQLLLNQKIGKTQLIQRLRIEERWQQKVLNFIPVDEIRYTTRFRYLLSLNIPVSTNKKVPSFALADELMLHAGKDIVYNYFDQNRLFAGIREQVNSSLSFDFGYMYVWQQKLSGYQYSRNHTVRLFFYWQPDWSKKHKTEQPATEIPLHH
jgi:hypothetical protein